MYDSLTVNDITTGINLELKIHDINLMNPHVDKVVDRIISTYLHRLQDKHHISRFGGASEDIYVHPTDPTYMVWEYKFAVGEEEDSPCYRMKIFLGGGSRNVFSSYLDIMKEDCLTV